jgi:ornithine cyclodeaminase
MLIINEEIQKKAISMKEVMDGVAIALKEYSDGRSVTPIRTAISTSKTNGTALFMPSLVEEASSLGVKFVSVFPDNKQKNKKTINGVMILADVNTGEPLCLLEASYLTVLRTGAATGLATHYLASPVASILCVIGTGRQARGLVDAVLCVRSISEIRLTNRSPEKAHQLATELKNHYKDCCPTIRVLENANEAACGAHIIVTATNSQTPVLAPESIAPGTHINGVGSFRPTMQEIPTGIVEASSKVVVESREAALEETGDLMIPIKQGLFHPHDLYGELGELLKGTKAGRESKEEITFFKSVGLAAMDVVVAKAIYDKVVQAGLGEKVFL